MIVAGGDEVVEVGECMFTKRRMLSGLSLSTFISILARATKAISPQQTMCILCL